jgi:hypothetical protein
MNAQLDVQRLADILLACWVVAHGSSEPLPLASGTLDISLKRAIERGAFPPEFRSLHVSHWKRFARNEKARQKRANSLISLSNLGCGDRI